MQIIKREPFANGGYPPIQSWSGVTPPEGYASVPDTLDTATFYAHNSFVTLTVEGDTVTAMAPNTTAWEAWKASLPPEPDLEPDLEPTLEERLTALEEENKTIKDENKLLTEQVRALSDQNDFQEELIVELAGVVYA